MTSEKDQRWQRWVDAAIKLCTDPKELVLCPKNQDDYLKVLDTNAGTEKIERHMYCPTCNAYNSALMWKPEGYENET
jgi:hypothetical protein